MAGYDGTGRSGLPTHPSHGPQGYWYNDQGSPGKRSPAANYTTMDYRRELARVERRIKRITILSILVGLAAVAAIVLSLLQSWSQ